ncbi:MAG: response regulator [Vampirovibrionia bacterium]
MDDTKKIYKVLIVDDANTTRVTLRNYLVNKHCERHEEYKIEADTAVDGLDALEKVENGDYDLVVSDIIMPNMNGFELVSSLSRRFPELCTVLITSSDVEDYIKMALVYNVTNIITKTNPFNYEEFSRVIHNLLIKDNLFGLSHYLLPETNINTIKIQNRDSIKLAIDRIKSIAINTKLDPTTVKKFVLSTEEAILNACIYASVENIGRERPKFSVFFDLEEFSPVHVSFGYDEEKLGISICDSGGKLQKEDILYWISRNISGEGVFDNHGRGLFLMRVNTDRMVINVEPGKRTEVVLIKYFEPKYEGHKPLYINQV